MSIEEIRYLQRREERPPIFPRHRIRIEHVRDGHMREADQTESDAPAEAESKAAGILVSPGTELCRIEHEHRRNRREVELVKERVQDVARILDVVGSLGLRAPGIDPGQEPLSDRGLRSRCVLKSRVEPCSHDAGQPFAAGMGSWSGPPTRRTVPAGTASRERGSRSASRSSTGRAGGWRSRRRGRARRSRFLPGRTVGRAHRPTSRSVQVHSAATRGSPHIAVPSPPHISLPCAAHQSECGRTPPARGRHHEEEPSPMTPPETVSTTTSGDAHATAPITRTFGPQGPTLGDLSDAYLQDYLVRQFRSHSTARGRTAHLVAFFGRDARAATLTTYQIRQYQLTRRAAGAATGTINRETSALHRMCTLAVHWGWLDTVPGFPDRLRENPPRQGFFEHPEYLAVRAHLPAPWQDILDLAYYSGWRKNEILGLTWDEIDEAGGVIRLSPGRSKTLVGRILPISPPIADALARRRARRDPDSLLVFHRDGIPVRRWRTAWRTACQAAGVPTRFLHDCRRTAARNLIRANVPERVAMLLTGHKSRAIFDRYNIIHERNCSRPGTNSSSISRNRHRRYQPASGPTRPDPPPRAPHHPSTSCDAAPRKGARPPANGASVGAWLGSGLDPEHGSILHVRGHVQAGISILPAPDGTFIHPRAVEPTKLSSSHNRPAPEAVTSAPADAQPTGAPTFRAFLRHRSTLMLFFARRIRCTCRASACRDR